MRCSIKNINLITFFDVSDRVAMEQKSDGSGFSLLYFCWFQLDRILTSKDGNPFSCKKECQISTPRGIFTCAEMWNWRYVCKNLEKWANLCFFRQTTTNLANIYEVWREIWESFINEFYHTSYTLLRKRIFLSNARNGYWNIISLTCPL